jgi:hypothetical protein
MKKSTQGCLGIALGIFSLVPTCTTAALVEYSGSRNLVYNGVERNVSLSITIDDNFNLAHSTVQYMHDNYPPQARVDMYYGYFDIVNADLNIAGAEEPITSDSGRYYVWVSDTDPNLSAFTLQTEDVVTDWSDHSRIQFLDESASPYDWSSWWGDAPTNDLPPLLGVNRLEVRGAGEFSTSLNLYSDPLYLHPVPIPAATLLFGSGLIGLLGAARRRNANLQ